MALSSRAGNFPGQDIAAPGLPGRRAGELCLIKSFYVIKSFMTLPFLKPMKYDIGGVLSSLNFIKQFTSGDMVTPFPEVRLWLSNTGLLKSLRQAAPWIRLRKIKMIPPPFIRLVVEWTLPILVSPSVCSCPSPVWKPCLGSLNTFLGGSRRIRTDPDWLILCQPPSSQCI